jgi:hypothetical protein
MTTTMCVPTIAETSTPTPTLRLALAKAAALRQLKARVEQGIEIRRRRVRYAEDLEEARAAKATWVQSYTDLLRQVFQGDTGAALADRCNDWTGRVLPEYADMELFVEQFYDEMDHRITKLRSVAREIAGMPEYLPPPLQKSDAPVTLVEAVETKPVEGSAQAAAPEPEPKAVVETVLLVHDDLSQVSADVRQFLIDLGLDVLPIRAAAPDGKSLVASLEHGRAAAFAVLLLGAEQSASLRNGGNCPPNVTFQLGYLVGRLGVPRVCVLCDGAADAFADPHGVHCLPKDAANGWHLQLARTLKRAGIEVDLNKLC